CRMMLNRGKSGRSRVLSPASIELMTMDHLSDAQKAGAEMFFGDGYHGFKAGWGLGVGVDIKRTDLFSVPGRFGWAGGLCTIGYCDPENGGVGLLLTQRLIDSPISPHIMSGF